MSFKIPEFPKLRVPQLRHKATTCRASIWAPLLHPMGLGCRGNWDKHEALAACWAPSKNAPCPWPRSPMSSQHPWNSGRQTYWLASGIKKKNSQILHRCWQFWQWAWNADRDMAFWKRKVQGPFVGQAGRYETLPGVWEQTLLSKWWARAGEEYRSHFSTCQWGWGLRLKQDVQMVFGYFPLSGRRKRCDSDSATASLQQRPGSQGIPKSELTGVSSKEKSSG